MTRFSVAIQHAPFDADRRRWTGAMVGQLRREDPELALTVVEDLERQGCWPTFRRALEAAGELPHHLLLQDDLELSGEFLRSVAGAIAARPDDVLMLYLKADEVFRARSRGEAWVETTGACGPAIVWPRPLVDRFLDWSDRHVDESFRWDTVRVSMWLHSTGRRSYATVPSLVEHLGSDRSVLGLSTEGRVASWFAGAEPPAAAIDWSRGLERPVRLEAHIRPYHWEFLKSRSGDGRSSPEENAGGRRARAADPRQT